MRFPYYIFIFSLISIFKTTYSQTLTIEKFSKCSNCKGKYIDFNSCKAINKIVDIENEHNFCLQNNVVSKYYGTLWRENAENTKINDSLNIYKNYINTLRKDLKKPDSLHCTIYAYEGLKAGLSENQFVKLEKIHKKIWKSREHAGWSIGYLLVTRFKWKAYLVISPDSKEFKHCIKSYKLNKTYPVWKQPNIPLEDLLIIGQDDDKINSILNKNEFGWGFSEQGIHTWITRYNKLKECNWMGSPLPSENNIPLFITTNFKNYHDYNSHIIIFP